VCIPDRWHIVPSRKTLLEVCPANSCLGSTAVRNNRRAIAVLEYIRRGFETYASQSQPDESGGRCSTGICPEPPHVAQSLPSDCRPVPWQRGQAIDSGTSAIKLQVFRRYAYAIISPVVNCPMYNFGAMPLRLFQWRYLYAASSRSLRPTTTGMGKRQIREDA
jgi:hypothetical protein